MTQKEQITNWYRHLTAVSNDDIQDFRVLLVDTRHTSDCLAAIKGMMLNQMERGWNDDVMSMLLDGSSENENSGIQFISTIGAFFIMMLHDKNFRGSEVIQEKVLDLLAENNALCIAALKGICQFKKQVIAIGAPIHVESSLLYHLIVVDKDTHQIFD